MTGTRVRLFPQSEGYAEPVVVTLSPPAGTVGPGPTDATLAAVLPVDKREPYRPPVYLPPYRGAVLPPALPDGRGDFDGIPLDAPQFVAQHLYGGVRFTLDVWERYFGRPAALWRAPGQPRLELVAILDWDNAQSGPGFIETGARRARSGEERLFALNFDVIAHETAHAFLFGEVGVPTPERLTAGYLAFQESFADLVALVTALHFPSVVDRLLARTGGNLYVLNLVARIGELSAVEQIRVADNDATLADVADLRLLADGEWFDPSGAERTQHDVAQVLTGAVFDVLVDLFQDNLVTAGVLPPPFDARGWDEASVERSFADLAAVAGDALARHEDRFRAALSRARDVVGATMAATMVALDADDLTLDLVAARMVEAAAGLGVARLETAFVENFRLRGIDPRPPLAAEAGARASWRRASYAARRARLTAVSRRPAPPADDPLVDLGLARRLMPHAHRTLD